MKRLFECRRWNDDNYNTWLGALLIFADTQEDAIGYFKQHEHGHTPASIKEITDFNGVIYEDLER